MAALLVMVLDVSEDVRNVQESVGLPLGWLSPRSAENKQLQVQSKEAFQTLVKGRGRINQTFLLERTNSSLANAKVKHPIF